MTLTRQELCKKTKFGASVTSHRPEGWAYYNFGGMTAIRTTAQAMPKDSCYSCHVQHARRDNVFLQVYPLLAEAAHLPVR